MKLFRAIIGVLALGLLTALLLFSAFATRNWPPVATLDQLRASQALTEVERILDQPARSWGGGDAPLELLAMRRGLALDQAVRNRLPVYGSREYRTPDQIKTLLLELTALSSKTAMGRYVFWQTTSRLCAFAGALFFGWLLILLAAGRPGRFSAAVRHAIPVTFILLIPSTPTLIECLERAPILNERSYFYAGLALFFYGLRNQQVRKLKLQEPVPQANARSVAADQNRARAA